MIKRTKSKFKSRNTKDRLKLTINGCNSCPQVINSSMRDSSNIQKYRPVGLVDQDSLNSYINSLISIEHIHNLVAQCQRKQPNDKEDLYTDTLECKIKAKLNENRNKIKVPKEVLKEFENIEGAIKMEISGCQYYGQAVKTPEHNSLLMQGKGVLKYPNSDKTSKSSNSNMNLHRRVFYGTFEKNCKIKGFECFSNGSLYSGSYSNSKPHGVGVLTSANGDVYSGNWVSGQKHGTGRFDSKAGCFIGDWQNSQIHGFGVSVSSDGVVYEGYWENSRKHGYGVEVNMGQSEFGKVYRALLLLNKSS